MAELQGVKVVETRLAEQSEAEVSPVPRRGSLTQRSGISLYPKY